jgi:hypothetical protein
MNAAVFAAPSLVLSLLCGLIGCSDERATSAVGSSPPAEPASQPPTQHLVLPAALHEDTASFDTMVGELGIQIDVGVPAADAESLQRLMRDSGFQIKRIRPVEPGCYTINVWGAIPHDATEFTIRRKGNEWEIVGDTSWVLIGSTEPADGGG